MTIQSIGSNYSFGSTKGTSQKQNSSSEDYDSEIQSLQEQKKTLQKQINDVKTGSQSQDKDEQLKVLQQQMDSVDSQIQQKQIEKAQAKNDGTAQIGNSSNNTKSDKDSVELNSSSLNGEIKLADIYNKTGKLASMSKMSKSKAAELASDAKVAEGNGNEKVAANLSAQAGKLSSSAQSELTQAANEASKVNKGTNLKATDTNAILAQQDKVDKDSDKSSASAAEKKDENNTGTDDSDK